MVPVVGGSVSFAVAPTSCRGLEQPRHVRVGPQVEVATRGKLDAKTSCNRILEVQSPEKRNYRSIIVRLKKTIQFA